jgi:hypothetical protein
LEGMLGWTKAADNNPQVLHRAAEISAWQPLMPQSRPARNEWLRM